MGGKKMSKNLNKISEIFGKLKNSMENFFKDNKPFDFFYESRFPIVEEALSPEKAKIFKMLSFEDKKLFVNVLIDEGKLSW